MLGERRGCKLMFDSNRTNGRIEIVVKVVQFRNPPSRLRCGGDRNDTEDGDNIIR